jgi:hypothetical protein
MRMCPTNHDPFALIDYHLAAIDSDVARGPMTRTDLGRQHTIVR